MDRNEFFAVLDQLTPSQIEARLPFWDHDQLKWVGEYLERRHSSAAQTEQRGVPPVVDAKSAEAVATAARANKLATIALIIAIGAMLAAIVAGLAVYEALQRQ
jgi:hypothetical protein